MNKDSITIIGAGNLGVAIAQGIAEKGLLSPRAITLTRRNTTSLKRLKEEGFNITSSNPDAVAASGTIFLCVQPKQLDDILSEIAPVLTPDHVLVSVITGVSLAQIRDQVTAGSPIVRAMPNTAIAIGESMTCIAAEKDSSASLPHVIKLFEALGRTLVIEENLMQAATVLGASGIAFFMRYLRAATQAGVQMGFDTGDAQEIARQTAKGASILLQEMGSHPEIEIDKVTTPQGCTIAGLNEMEHQGFSSSLIRGVMTSFEKITSIRS